MEYFLERIAKLLYAENGNRLNTHCLVFPNRRAGLFFKKYLAVELEKPIWTPAVMTISDLFGSLSTLQPAENEILLFELYKIYRSISKTQESFDDFYFWGDMLLNDFDDVDKYLADASKLFQNVQDLRKIDQQFGGLTEDQVEIVQKFWVNFNPEKPTDEKSKFISIWSILNTLYNEFRRLLKEKNLAYEGMIFRDVVENEDLINSERIKWEMVHFIGFNALNECEKRLMLKLKENGKAKFYWDYDNSYVKQNELNSAGFFLRDNLRIFGNDMPVDWNYNTLLSSGSSEVRRRIIDTSSDVAQVKILKQLLREIPDLTAENAHHTSIVLADENLLLPVLTSLPEDAGDINITMGYPLKQTSVYSLVVHLLDMQRNARIVDNVVLFNYTDVLRVLKNPLISGFMDESEISIITEIVANNLIWISSDRFKVFEKLSEIFIRPLSSSQISDYLKYILSLVASNDTTEKVNNSVPKSILNEFIYRVILSINRLDAIAGSPDISISIDTWTRLLERLLRMQAVPFSGEPLSGIQIMGILETRTLDFKNLIVLSVNEGILPAVTTSSSFIPFSLREAFRLPSVNHQESVYAYHFYRLLHRVENVTFLFNSNPEGLRSGEMSRFLQQMKYEPSLNPEFRNLSFEIKNPASPVKIIGRTEEHSKQLLTEYETGNRVKILSPSAINTWLNCSMKFYYRYVNGLKEPEKVSGEIDPAIFGTMLHTAMKNIYAGYIGKVLSQDIIEAILINKQAISDQIKSAINEKFRRENDTLLAINEMMVREVLYKYITRVLEMDRTAAPFAILAVEKLVRFPVIFKTEDGEHAIMAGGIIDRVDLKEGLTRIVDYKTGKIADAISTVADLFEDDRNKDYDGWLQTLLYCEGFLTETPGYKVRPSVYKLAKSPDENDSDKLRIKESHAGEFFLEDYNIVKQEFVEALETTVSSIFSAKKPFIMTSDIRNKCSYCPYRILCMR